LFNPSPQRADPQVWAPDAVLQPVRQGDVGFANTDWDKVPRLDYRTEKFRQLAVPDPARVVEDPSEFEPWQPRQLSESLTAVDTPTSPSAPVKSGSDGHGRHAAQSHVPRPQSADDAAKESSEGSHKVAPDQPDESQDLEAGGRGPDRTEDTTQVETSEALKAGQAADDGEAKSDRSEDTDETQQQAGHANPAAPEAEGETGSADPANVTTDSPATTLDSAAVQEACDNARQAGLEQGREEGLAQGREQALEEARLEREAALEAAAADKAQALQQLREELEGEIDPLKRQLNKAAEQVQSLAGQPDKLYEHIKRLSLHLAEQLVLGELNLSSAAIERLIQRCLDELDLHGNHVVTLELNPQDKARLQERAGEMSQALSVQAVSSLQPGSVRAIINDTLVEDLVGHRLEALARSLLVQPEVWREQSPFFRQPLAQRDAEVQDAAARVVSPREAKSKTSSAERAEDPVVSHASDLVPDVPREEAGESPNVESGEPVTPDAGDSDPPQDSREGPHD
jgi:flagellar biosynthesis/type III secretory pathway protein FliH